jgi:hypothetical protein
MNHPDIKHMNLKINNPNTQGDRSFQASVCSCFDCIYKSLIQIKSIKIHTGPSVYIIVATVFCFIDNGVGAQN